MEINPNSIKRKAVREAAAYTDAAIERAALNEEGVRTVRTSTIDGTPDLSTLTVEFENDNKKFGYDEATLYGNIIKTEDGNIRVQVKARINSESDLAELNLQVSLID